MKPAYFRLFVFAAFAILAISILWPACGSCARAMASVHGIPLDYIGLAFYLTLGVATLTPLRGLALYGVFPALGFHLFMVSEMRRDHHGCAVCLAVGGLCLVAALISQRLTRSMVVPALSILLGTIGARFLVTSFPTDELAAQPALEKMLETERKQPVSPGDLMIYVFSKEGCSVCRHFWSEVAPQLQGDFGSHLQFKKMDPQDLSVPTPTFVVCSSYAPPTVITGLPPQANLASYLRGQAFWRPQTH